MLGRRFKEPNNIYIYRERDFVLFTKRYDKDCSTCCLLLTGIKDRPTWQGVTTYPNLLVLGLAIPSILRTILLNLLNRLSYCGWYRVVLILAISTHWHTSEISVDLTFQSCVQCEHNSILQSNMWNFRGMVTVLACMFYSIITFVHLVKKDNNKFVFSLSNSIYNFL